MRLDDRFTDRQPESHTLSREFLALFYLMEFLKDLFFMIVRDAGTGPLPVLAASAEHAGHGPRDRLKVLRAPHPNGSPCPPAARSDTLS